MGETMSTDAELLRRYAEEKSEAAFAELVRLHLNLVYFAALRQVGGDTHRAQDVAQTVFTDLARKANSLTGRATLTGWLHTSTRFAATKLRRADFSRQQHEQEATTMNALLSDPDPAAEWARLRPLIDDAIHELDERDREAVLLRYFENRPFAEIGATLRLSDDAARMRVDRALEKLRAALARRGVKSTSAALATIFANQVAASAPVGLASAITGAALAGVTVGTGFFMSTTTAILSAVALAAIGSTAYQWNHAFRAESELAALTVDRDGLRAQLRAEQQRATQDTATLRGEVDALKAKQATVAVAPRAASAATSAPSAAAAPTTYEVLRRSSINKAMMNNLRQIAAARDQFQIQNGRPAASVEELVGEYKFIRALVAVNGESYAALSMIPGQPLSATASDGVTVTYDPSAPPTPAPSGSMDPLAERIKELGQKLNSAGREATTAYLAAHNGQPPASPDALIPYFANPQDGADFVEFLEAMKQAQTHSSAGNK